MVWQLLARCCCRPALRSWSPDCSVAANWLSQHTIATSSALWLPFPICVYWIASELYARAGKTPLLNPTLLTIAALGLALLGFGVPYPIYFESVSVLHWRSLCIGISRISCVKCPSSRSH